MTEGKKQATAEDAMLEAVSSTLAETLPKGDEYHRHISLDSQLDSDLRLDSLGRAELLVTVERTFDVALPERVLSDADTPRAILNEVMQVCGEEPRPPDAAETGSLEGVKATGTNRERFTAAPFKTLREALHSTDAGFRGPASQQRSFGEKMTGLQHMFATAKVGRSISKEDYNEEVEALRTELLEAQIALRERDIPVYLIIAGIEGAGKGEVVNTLDEWLDARGVNVYAFWDESDEERERPRAWRFWRAMPRRGQISVFFGGWYLWPIEQRFAGDWDDAKVDQCMSGVRELERTLINDGAVIIKCWYHFAEDVQRQRLDELARSDRSRWKMLPKKSHFSEQYQHFEEIADRVVRSTDTGRAPWHVIEATDRRYRDITTGRILLHAIQQALAQPPHADRRVGDSPTNTDDKLLPNTPETHVTLLDRIDLSQTIEHSDYRKRLEELQAELNDLAWRAYTHKISTVLVFEGVDAAGKGGAIRRVTQATDARLREVIPVAAPTDEEKAHHYLWRFWRNIPRAGRMTIFDRSWYGRVLVERVEGFTADANWARAYLEINDFEEQLSHAGIIVQKFWLQISKEEQLERFEARENTPYKRYKITDEDRRNREKWDEYREAVNEMLARTSAQHAPWNLIAGNDKRFARIQVLETVTAALREALRNKAG